MGGKWPTVAAGVEEVRLGARGVRRGAQEGSGGGGPPSSRGCRKVHRASGRRALNTVPAKFACSVARGLPPSSPARWMLRHWWSTLCQRGEFERAGIWATTGRLVGSPTSGQSSRSRYIAGMQRQCAPKCGSWSAAACWGGGCSPQGIGDIWSKGGAGPQQVRTACKMQVAPWRGCNSSPNRGVGRACHEASWLARQALQGSPRRSIGETKGGTARAG